MSADLRVEVQKTVRAPLEPRFLRRVLAAALLEPAVAARLPGSNLELAVRVTGDRTLRRLNREFLGEDHATDVLSFPSGDGAATGRGPGLARPLDEDGTRYLGDLALSWPAVVRQAAEHGHPAEVEAALLAVHGLLHLLGWDHAGVAEEREMTRVTLGCLARAGIDPSSGRLKTARS